MKETKSGNLWLAEMKQLLTAPTYYCYILALLLVLVLQYFPEVRFADGALLSEADSFGAACARVFADKFGAFLVFFPAFVVATAAVRDKRDRKLGRVIVRETQTAFSAVASRMLVQLILLFLPVLIVATISATRMSAGTEGAEQFIWLSIAWLLPTLAFVTAFTGLVTEVAGTCLPGILAQLVVWVFSTGSTAEVGDYNTSIAIRHAVFGGYEGYLANQGQLVVNRIVVVFIAAVCMFAAVAVKNHKGNKKNN